MTKEKQIELILQLINKDDAVKAPMLSNKKKTKKEKEQEQEREVIENAIKSRTLREIRKNLRKQFQKSIKEISLFQNCFINLIYQKTTTKT